MAYVPKVKVEITPRLNVDRTIALSNDDLYLQLHGDTTDGDYYFSGNLTALTLSTTALSATTANFSGASAYTFSATTYYSGTTPLWSIIYNAKTIVRDGINTFTGGTFGDYTVNITGLSISNLYTSGITTFVSASATTFSATTYYSGSTPLQTILNSYTGITMSGTNIGSGTGLVFKDVTGTTNINFRTLIGTSGVTITTTGNTVNVVSVINGNNLGSGAGLFAIRSGNLLKFKSIYGGGATTITPSTNGITITSPAIPASAYLWTVGNTGSYSLKTNNGTDTVLGNYSIAAGKISYIDGNYSMIGGGQNNTIKKGLFNVIGGGYHNYVNKSQYTFNGGGKSQTIDTSHYSSIVGGVRNYIKNNRYSFIGGGNLNVISQNTTVYVHNVIVGGSGNTISRSSYNFIGNGISNKIYNSSKSTHHNAILAGTNNIIKDAVNSSILAGTTHTLTADNSAIIGGASYTFAQSNAVLLSRGFLQNVNFGGTYMLTWDGTSKEILKQAMISGIFGSNVNGLNTYTGGTFSAQTINISGLSISNLYTSGLTTFVSASATTFSATTYYSGTTPLSTIIYNIVSNSTGATLQTFSAGTNLDLFTGSTYPNVTYSLKDRINVPFGISGGSFFQTSTNINYYQGDSIHDGDVHVLAPNDLTANNAILNNISSTAITSTSAVIDTILNLSAETNYLTVNNNFTTPIGYVDQLTSYQGNFEFELSATTYYSGSTPLQSILNNYVTSVVNYQPQLDTKLNKSGDTFTNTLRGDAFSANTFSASTINSGSTNLYNIFQPLGNYLTSIPALNYLAISGGTVTGATYINNSFSANTFYSGSTNLYSIFATTGQIINYQTQLDTKVNRSGDTMTGQLNAPAISATTISANTLYSGTTELSRLFPYDISTYRKNNVSGTERWYGAHMQASTITTFASLSGVCYAHPLVISKRCTLDRLGLSINSVSAAIGVERAHIGIYNDNGNIYPNQLLVDSGEIVTSAATNISSVVISQTLEPGLYWLVILHNTSNVTYRAFSTSQNIILGYPATGPTAASSGMISAAKTYGALPSTFPGSPSYAANAPHLIVYRIAT